MSFNRRTFLGGALAGLATAPLWGAERSSASRNAEVVTRPDTLFLTWRRDPTTTMTVQWVGADGPVGLVEYRTQGSEIWRTQTCTKRRYAQTDLQVFRSELEGLQPGADYEFRVHPAMPPERFRTMPAKATDVIHFISGGDCGVNEHTVANNIQAARQDPMFAIIGGDLAYENGKAADIHYKFLVNYSRHMINDGRLIPMITCLGNHEVDGSYGQPREKAPFFYALFDGLYPEQGFATLDFGDYLSLVLLDTGHTTAIEGLQTDWLEKTLKDRVDHPHVLVVNHVPAYPSHRNMNAVAGKVGTGAGNREHWTPLFDRYRVPVVLEHHDHTFKRSKPLIDGMADVNGVHYMGDGSWGRIRPPQPLEDMPYLLKTSKDYHLSLHRIEGDERFHMALNDAGRIVDVCRTAQRVRGSVAGGI